jgi:hypothetical protein
MAHPPYIPKPDPISVRELASLPFRLGYAALCIGGIMLQNRLRRRKR